MLAVGSDAGMSGAVRLCGEAALRSGAGKVTVVTRTVHAALVNVACPELMVRGMEDIESLHGLMSEVDVVVTGTGLGQGDWGKEMMNACLGAPVPLVVDADGLNLLAQAQPGTLRRESGQWVLTPHPAEAGRLLGCSAGDVQRDRVGSAVRIAEKFGAIAVLKGCGTVIAHPDRRYAICRLDQCIFYSCRLRGQH